MDTSDNLTNPPPPNPSTCPGTAGEPAPAPAGFPSHFGRYRVLSEVGRGGMGVVYKAQDTALQRMVALKVPRFGPGTGPEIIERFLAEARAAATLNHPNLCPIYDIGEAAGVHYLAMPYIEGQPLSTLVADCARRPAAETARLIATLARAMQVAHEQGFVHRDLKPANVILTAAGTPIIMDFGLAVRPTHDESRLTQSGMIVGTPAYMAPEQAESHGAPGPPSDIYSLGVVLYQLLTGRLPFVGQTLDVLVQHRHNAPPPPSSLRPDLDPRLEAVCLKALAKRPGARFASMAEFAEALENYAAQPPTSAGRGRPTLFRRLWGWLRKTLIRPFQPGPSPAPAAAPTPLPSLPQEDAPPPGTNCTLPIPILDPPSHDASSAARLSDDPEAVVVTATLREATPKAIEPPSVEPLFNRPFGKYELLRKLGQGETGIVYLARHVEQGWQAAVKVLPGARFSSPACVQRLLREARVGAGLRHPNLCQILDAGTEQGEFYLAMEYLEGRTLRGHLQDARAGLAVPLACYHAYQLFDSLAYLARHGVVHRDVKPGNVMVCAGDRLKLMDLGLAKVPDPEEGRLTLSGIILGTPAYMAPEQVDDASRATAASDLYAAGATLFEMLTGTTPFQGESPVALMQKVLGEAPPDARTRRPDLPEPLARLVARLLDKLPERRPDHDEVLAVLRDVCRGLAPLLPETRPPRVSGTPTVTAIQNVSMVARIDRAAERINNEDVDDLVALLPTEDGKIRLGNYFLEERIGPRSAVNTYRARHFLAGHPFIVRLLPLALSQMAPERLRGLLGQRARLMQISMQSPHLSRLLDIGKAQLREGTFDTLYYTVEDFLPGRAVSELIAAPRLEAADVAKCLGGAARGLWSLHQNGILHGNLHPGKLFFDGDSALLRVADLSHARPLEAVPPPRDEAPSAINDLDWLGDSLARRRQYMAPEILCDGEAPALLTEQYALGVIFVELLAHRGLRTHHNDLKLMKCVQQDLQDCLFEITETFPRLGRVLRRMVAINPQARYPDLAAVLDALVQTDRPSRRGAAAQPGRESRKGRTPAPPPDDPYDVFVSYRRRSGAEVARAIVAGLKQQDLRTFLDVDSLNSGRFDERLLDTIEATPNFVVILSEGSLGRCREEGDWLRREIAHAIQTGRNIVPVTMPRFQKLDLEELPEDIAELPRFNFLDYRHDYFDGFIDRLVGFLQARRE